MLKSHKS